LGSIGGVRYAARVARILVVDDQPATSRCPTSMERPSIALSSNWLRHGQSPC
jgi:hypothetical protein